MKTRLLACALASLCLLPSCAFDEGKGAEEDALEVYESKTDSFRNPTEHGELVFGVPQAAKLEKGKEFHAWDFVLSDEAEVNLKTLLVTANLDTVMYLYKFDETTQGYGPYKFKNDDAGPDTVASELNEELEAGRYRVLVKGFKTKLRGSFKVVADCDGAGCAASSCDIASFDGLSATRSDSCGELFSAALSTEATGESSAVVTLDERCSLPASVAAAVEQYVEYFGGVDEFNDAFNFGSPGDPVEIDVSWKSHANGALYVQVDGGGDEAAMDYLIAGDGQVVAHYQHNQSPDHTLYCDGGIEFLEDGDCFFQYTENFPHAAADERQVSATVTAATAQGQIERTALVAVQAYVAELGLASDVNIEVDAAIWDLGAQDAAGRVRVKAAGKDAFVYELEAMANTQFQFTIRRGTAKAAYDCKEL